MDPDDEHIPGADLDVRQQQLDEQIAGEEKEETQNVESLGAADAIGVAALAEGTVMGVGPP
eukprot:10485560-Prorocentrum_lima.AAC.1